MLPIVKVVNVFTEKADVYCGRGSPLEIPSKINNEHGRKSVIKQYKVYLQEQLALHNQSIKRQLTIIKKIAKKKGEVKLGCFCAPKQCHCDVLKDYIINDFKKGEK